MSSIKLKAILTGATGMVGEGVLMKCLKSIEVEEILVIGRRSCQVSDPKLKELIIPDLSDISSIENLVQGYNACFFCAGVSSVGMKEPEYYSLTYTLTMNFATTLSKINPGMTFCYVSGSGTDSSEKGRMMWAKVKGKTENDLTKLPFKQVCNFRPGLMKPTPGQKNVPGFAKLILWIFPLLMAILPSFACTLKEVGQAMIRVAGLSNDKKVFEVKDIVALAKR